MTKWKDKKAAVQSLENNGKVNPQDLIAAARRTSHPCHDDFTWDVAQAAGERWYDQACTLIRRCKFKVIVEETQVGIEVAQYVSTPDAYEGEPTYSSLTKMRGVTKVSAVLSAEIAMLHGMATRVYGIALAKQGMVGAGVVTQLEVIRDQLEALKAEVAE